MTRLIRYLPRDALGWRARIDATGPMAPAWFKGVLARVLADPHAEPDGLLILADALEEAARECGTCGQVSLHRDLRALADLPRMLAPHRATSSEAA